MWCEQCIEVGPNLALLAWRCERRKRMPADGDAENHRLAMDETVDTHFYETPTAPAGVQYIQYTPALRRDLLVARCEPQFKPYDNRDIGILIYNFSYCNYILRGNQECDGNRWNGRGSHPPSYRWRKRTITITIHDGHFASNSTVLPLSLHEEIGNARPIPPQDVDGPLLRPETPFPSGAVSTKYSMPLGGPA